MGSMRKQDWLLLFTGITLGILGVVFYFFPYVLFPNISADRLAQLSPAVKGETSSSWSEDWEVKKWSVWQWDCPANIAACPRPNGGTLGLVGGPAEWQVAGTVNGKNFVETWSVAEWAGSVCGTRNSVKRVITASPPTPSLKLPAPYTESNYSSQSNTAVSGGLYTMLIQGYLFSGDQGIVASYTCYPKKWHVEGHFE